MPRRYATFLTAITLLWSAMPCEGAAQTPSPKASQAALKPVPGALASRQAQHAPALATSAYEGKTVLSVDLPAVTGPDRDHLLQLLPQKVGTPLQRGSEGDSIRVL